MTWRRTIAMLACGALALAASAAQADPRLVSQPYKPDAVVLVDGKLGVQATIAFAEDESIENVAVGDSQKWQITPNKRANLLFVKPLEAGARTNMTVVTDKRTYFFDLVTTLKANPLYMLRFTYGSTPGAPAAAATGAGLAAVPPASAPVAAPPPAKAQSDAAPAEAPPAQPQFVEAPVVQPVTEAARPFSDSFADLTAEEQAVIEDGSAQPDPAAPVPYNFAWTRKGDSSLLPERIYDDGSATYMRWGEKQAMPAILVRNSQGEEGPVNYAVRGDTIVLDSVPGLIVLRTGEDMATLENMGRAQSGSSNAGAEPAEPVQTSLDLGRRIGTMRDHRGLSTRERG